MPMAKILSKLNQNQDKTVFSHFVWFLLFSVLAKINWVQINIKFKIIHSVAVK